MYRTYSYKDMPEPVMRRREEKREISPTPPPPQKREEKKDGIFGGIFDNIETERNIGMQIPLKKINN